MVRCCLFQEPLFSSSACFKNRLFQEFKENGSFLNSRTASGSWNKQQRTIVFWTAEQPLFLNEPQEPLEELLVSRTAQRKEAEEKHESFCFKKKKKHQTRRQQEDNYSFQEKEETPNKKTINN